MAWVLQRLGQTLSKDGFMTPHASSLLSTALLLAIGSVAHASGPRIQDLAAVERAAIEEVERQAPGSTAQVSPLDRRLQLVACDQPLQSSLPPNVTIGPRVNLRVGCTAGTVQWSVNVPVAVSTEAAVVVANHAIPMGSPVGPADIRVETRRFPGTARCCASSPEAVVGFLVRRSIQADAVIPMDALDRPPAIKRGEVVVVVAVLPGIEIRSSGVALADARVGETVRIRHSTSLKVIQARADTPGVVRVDR